MHFVDRQAKYPNRWTIIHADGSSEIVTFVRNDEPIVEGTPMNAATLNTLSDVAGADVAKEAAELAASNAKASQNAAESSASSAYASAQSSEDSAKRADAKAVSADTSETNAATSATASAASASAAKKSQAAAAGSASAASGSATDAAKSQTAAATSEANAATSEANALRYSQEAGAKANTDKTLRIEDAPADAKAVGDTLDSIMLMLVTGNLTFGLYTGTGEVLCASDGSVLIANKTL